jgi:hypothetical protein
MSIAQKIREQVTLDSASGQVRRYTHTAVDSGDGYIVDNSGTVNYATGQFVLPVLPVVSESVWNSATDNWGSQSGGSERHSFDSGTVTVYYSQDGSGSTGSIDTLVSAPGFMLQLLPAGLDERIVPWSLLFTMGGNTYSDRAGVLYCNIDPQTGAGIASGSVDYLTGRAWVSGFSGDTSSFSLKSMLTRFGDWVSTQASFRTAIAPIKPETLTVTAVSEDGEPLTATADEHGVISGEWIEGEVNYQFGTASIRFGKDLSGTWSPRRVDPGTIRYNAVAYKSVPLAKSILGIDAVRLPVDGRVPIYRPGYVVLVMHTKDEAPTTISNGQSISADRGRLAWVRLIDDDGKTVNPNKYTLDRLAGEITIPDVSGLTQPLTLRHTVADLRLVTDAQITGEISLSRPLTHAFPKDESLIASCLVQGDRKARVSLVFDQASWNGSTWSDSQQGDAATANLNIIDYPIEVTNAGADTDRWALRFTDSTHGQVISEKRGILGTFDTSQSLALINARTTEPDGSGGVPYFFIDQRAWGIGWSAGNTIRINTVGAISDIWVSRAIQQSDEPFDKGADGCEIYALGNIDRP